MKRNLAKNQKGFLSMVAILIVVMISFICAMAAYQFITDSRTSATELSSIQAFYLAQSGLEKASHNLVNNSITCPNITGNAAYTNATFSNASGVAASGVFTVTAALTNTSTTLNGNLTASATTIPLTSSTNFANANSNGIDGVVLIDNELINYNGISGNNLSNATRGVAGTTAAAHTSGASVAQIQCVLTSTGYVPSSTTPNAQRKLQKILSGQQTFLIGSSTPTLATAGSISLTGNAVVTNSSVTSSSSNFTGSTIFSGSNVVFNGNGATQVGNGSGGLVTSSQSGGNIKADVVQSSSTVNSSNLFGYYFKQSKAVVQANSNQTYNSSNINGVTFQSAGQKVIWINSYFNVAGPTTIGSPSSPVIIVVNENANLSGQVTIYGLLYVINGLTMSGQATINGLVAVEGAVNNSGNATLNLNTGILSTLGPYLNSSLNYNSRPAALQEVIP